MSNGPIAGIPVLAGGIIIIMTGAPPPPLAGAAVWSLPVSDDGAEAAAAGLNVATGGFHTLNFTGGAPPAVDEGGAAPPGRAPNAL